MKKLLVLGNSHMVAFKQGWEQSELEAEFAPTYIAAPGNWFNDFELSGTVMTPTSERLRDLMARTAPGVEKIDLGEWDAFVLVGLFLRPLLVVRIYDTHRLPRHRADGKQIVSESAFETAVTDAMHGTAAYQTATKLRQVSDAPICVVTEPLPSANLDPELQELWGGHEHLPFLYATYDRHFAGLFDGLDVEVVTQPAETIAGKMFTDPRFSEGATKMLDGDAYDGREHYHMNSEFGAIMVRETAARLRARFGALSGSPG